jgi:hypothetical protein
MTITQVLAELCYDSQSGRGCPLKLQAALKMTPYQVVHILNAERDRDGKLVIDQSKQGPVMTVEERFTWAWVLRCLPRWLIVRKWREQFNGAT